MTVKRKNLSTPEQPPIATNEPAIIDLVIEDIKALNEEGCTALIPHLRDRKAFGISKYGTPLQVSNSRDHRQDAFQELLDFIAYTKQGSERGDEEMGNFYALAVATAATFLELIDDPENQFANKKT